MGNNCICIHYQNTQNINEDLSNNVNKIDENELLEKFDNEDSIKSDFNMKGNTNSVSEKKLIDINSLKKKTTLTSEDITKLNNIIRGYLFRKKFLNGNLKKELEEFNENLILKFIEKAKNEKIEKIIKENSNLLSSSWNDFYQEDPIQDINTEISKIKKYEKGIKITYINNNIPITD